MLQQMVSLDHFAGPGDALGSVGGLPLDLFVECSPSVCAFDIHIVKINVIITYEIHITYQIKVEYFGLGLPKPEILPFPLSVFDGFFLSNDSTLCGHLLLLWPLTLQLLRVMVNLVLGSFPDFYSYHLSSF